jgi:hypothetical protein
MLRAGIGSARQGEGASHLAFRHTILLERIRAEFVKNVGVGARLRVLGKSESSHRNQDLDADGCPSHCDLLPGENLLPFLRRLHGKITQVFPLAESTVFGVKLESDRNQRRFVMNHRFFLWTFAAIVAFVLAAPAAAHHGWSGQDTQEFELTGIVETPLSLAGPHGTMKVRAEGQVWDITLAPPARVERAGLKEGMIPIGATVTVYGHRNKDTKRFEVKTERVTWNKRTFNVYPDRK